MKIRTKLTLQFLIIGGAIMIGASWAIYFSSSEFRRNDFYQRLESKAINTAKLLIEVDEISPELLRRIERDNPINLPDEKIIIFDYKNDTLYNTDDNRELYITVKDLNRARLYRRITFEQGDFEILGLLYTESYDRFVVIAAARDIDGLNQLRNLRIILFLVCLSSLVLIFIAGWFYSNRALSPISDVVARVEEISIASLNLRVDEGNGTDEIARLAKTFNNMLERLEEAFNMQRDFISNASHEIRTPLTSIYGQLQVLLMKERSVSDYKAAVGSVIDDIRNLTDMTNSLLLLAQTQSETSDKKLNRVRIDELLWQAAEDLKKVHPEYNVNIRISFLNSSGDADDMTVEGNDYLLKVALANIIENGCKYSDNHSVDVKIIPEGKELVLHFTDTGKGIPEEDIEKIFEPFKRGSNVQSISGHGIGLSLVRGIVKNYNGILKLSSRLGKGTEVTIILPIAGNIHAL